MYFNLVCLSSAGGHILPGCGSSSLIALSHNSFNAPTKSKAGRQTSEIFYEAIHMTLHTLWRREEIKNASVLLLKRECDPHPEEKSLSSDAPPIM